ncbi:MAG: hypothetical protein EZS28_009967 [Streblomastix strix]|uniref:Uncharacterized protein n=1 Tax=Streblomastix strix TaxID=222440 RepID=A0A5J4WHG4_9EUKA|nr:MAG: hypothetical protein EZS28_009967 [Streblomastix strix]
MFIKDIDRIVGGYLCKKCNQKLFNRTSDNFSRDLKKHIESCKDPDQQKHPKLDKLAQPFMPYLKSNKTIQKLFTTGQTKLFPKDQEQGVSDILQPTKNYMCIDAETVEELQREAQDQEDDQIYAQLQPLSIVIGTQINNKIQSKYIDIQTQNFMNKFIEQMWELANEKQVTIRHVDYPLELVFKDVLTFIPPTTLDNFVHKYRNGTKLTKGKFTHGSFNTSNVNQFLSSTEPKKDYQEYVDDFVSLNTNGNNKFEDRWSYLKYYNIRDVELQLCVEDFDINGDYNIETGNKEYKFYSEKLNKKIEGYLQQDIKAGRDTTNNVTANDIDYFNELIPNKYCYCQAKFTNVNKLTLERIDKNIAHTKDNCKLACQLCNLT